MAFKSAWAPQGAIAALLGHAADGIQVPVSAHLTWRNVRSNKSASRDSKVVALNQDTGKVVWRQTLGDYAAGVTTAKAWTRSGLRHNELTQGSPRCGSR
jgi:outer membrane protein assembly factor BamB